MTIAKHIGQAEGGLSRFLRGEMSGKELVERRRVSNISILLTYQCPARCGHCVFRSDMTRTETVDVEDAAVFIKAASRQVPPPCLGFSGGEPFLQLGMMKELAKCAHKLGMVWEVISSSVWCKGYKHAREVLSDLQALGLGSYCTSVDRYHARHVPPRKMKDAISAALDIGLHVCIKTMMDAHSQESAKVQVGEILELPAETIERCRLEPTYLVPVGRARSATADLLYRDKDLREGCPFSTEVITLSPLGFVYPCCGMVAGEAPESAGLFIHGRFHRSSVDEVAELIDNLKNDLFFKLLQVLGPYRLLEIAKSRNPGLKTRKKFVGTCDVCLEFTRNAGVIEATQELLAGWGELLGDASLSAQTV